MEEAVAPRRPAGRNGLDPRSESAEVRDPCSCSAERRGGRTKRGAPGAPRRNLEVADFRRFRARDKD
eukprot:9303953-Alexandrium_andersonii.AAC.1